MSYLIGLIVLLGGAYLFQRSKLKSAEALNDNNEALKEVQKINGEVEKNKGLLGAEEEKRKEIAKETEDEKTNTNADAGFFNSRK